MVCVEVSVPQVGRVDPGFWAGRRVLITGHTGFKGAWLSIWLQSLGAVVTGLANGVPTEPSLYALARVSESMEGELEIDIRDFDALADGVRRAAPEVVIHMAAQSIVRRSFVDPRETYETNVIGTVNVLDAVRLADGVRVVVNVTSDKCYENREWDWGYREDDSLGGFDPYSSSKACAELVTAAFRRSFFEADAAGPRLVSVRAGNVIGGGDWGEDRLLADAMRSALSGEPLRVRNPYAVRPWQYVLNPLSGYLVLAQAVWDSPAFATAWNFGPADEEARSVEWIVERVRQLWPDKLRWEHDAGPRPHEASYLRVDSSRARARLDWRPTWNLEDALQRTVAWYEAFAGGADVPATTLEQVKEFEAAHADTPSAIH